MIGKLIAAVILCAGLGAGAQVIQSDCTPAELKILQSPDIVNQFTRGKMMAQDCTPLKSSPEKEMLLVAHVVNAAGGYESYLSLFERKGFTEQAVPIFKSALIGFDIFPVLNNMVHRLLFVHPSSDKLKLVMYLNLQIAPATSKLSRWEYTYDKKELVEAANKYWMLEAGVMPKIYDEKGVFRALIESRSVEL